ncbi:spindle assembly checkpoint component MAD1-like [Helianthus annuus]|uniref:spindle assembly checkpoint component MAD1-like n=1 Tax=Helianthus annuus TaxID=4232 RepID=UPI000B8F5F44|nr:spindle assembly checkpoint component MAD1-like [Helianthus annuus]
MENEFYNAFATAPGTSVTVAQSVNMENETGTLQKPPKLMCIEEYYSWQERFENWVQGNPLRSWEYIEKNAYSIWIALRTKFEGSTEMIKSKKSLLKKEFDLFSSLPGETTKIIQEPELMKEWMDVFANDDKNQDGESVSSDDSSEKTQVFDQSSTDKKDKKYNELNEMKEKLLLDVKYIKESYDVLNRTVNSLEKTNSEREDALTMMNATMMTKQKTINHYIEEYAELKKELETEKIENERIRRLLLSYSSFEVFQDKKTEKKDTGYPRPNNIEEYLKLKAQQTEDFSKRNSQGKSDKEIPRYYQYLLTQASTLERFSKNLCQQLSERDDESMRKDYIEHIMSFKKYKGEKAQYKEWTIGELKEELERIEKMNKEKIKHTPPVWSKYMKNVTDNVLRLKRMKEELIAANFGSRNQVTRWKEENVMASYKKLEELRKKNPNVPQKPDYPEAVVPARP